ncbi:Diuretic hormone [Orchesella cincta]|uniref:Diuretic hormone n=1 Tax=Orchesella cincta TaxID=48709 RepID=A0A1D2NCN1_ORCCI|nr:Diuretic hormone [Orchesella cincta]
MTVKVDPEASRFENVENFNFFSLCPSVTGNEQHFSQTRISPPSPKNGFPTKSLICRTMTVSQLPEGVSATVFKPFTNSDQQIRPQQTKSSATTPNHSQSENSFTPAGAVDLEQHCKEEKMHKISHKATDMIGKSSRFARLLADGLSRRSSDDDSCSQNFTSSSLPVRPIKSYYHPTGHWEYGMILIVLFLLSTFSTSTMVACVPLGQSGVGGGGGDGAMPSSSSSSSMEEMSNSRILELKPQHQNQPSDSSISYSVQPKGQLFLPSRLSENPPQSSYFNGRGRGGAVGEEQGNHNDQQSRTTSNFLRFHHLPDQSTFTTGENHFQRAPIQKSSPSHQNQDLVRSVIDGAENELESDDDVDAPSPAVGVDDDSEDSEWETVIDPHLYVLTEWNTQPYREQFPLLQQQRKRRNSGMGPSLSIVNPLDVLRQRLLLEIARRKMRQSHNQIIANEEILRKIGRRR